jgi:hypothetical protein
MSVISSPGFLCIRIWESLARLVGEVIPCRAGAVLDDVSEHRPTP